MSITWNELARKKQKLPIGNWTTWLILAGRGFGKTKTGAESVMQLIHSNQYKQIGIVGKNIQEAKQIMIEGTSGILTTTIVQNDNQSNLKYLPSKKQILFNNGAKIFIFSGDNPNSIRGFQFDLVWIDEFAKFHNPSDLWDQIMFSLRLGSDPKCIITTTPKPLSIFKELRQDKSVHITTGSTFENRKNLSKRFITNMEAKYQNTFLGQQEIFGKLIFSPQHPLWKKCNILYKAINIDCLEIIIIGIDPAVTHTTKSDETGIIVAGLGLDKLLYVINDLSGKFSGSEWAKVVTRASYDYNASYIIVETNNGGDLVVENLQSINSNLSIKKVHALKGKIARAEPISILYETNRVFHFKEFPKLEAQMCNLSYDSNHNTSPDRVDALVWTLSELRNYSNKTNSCNLEII